MYFITVRIYDENIVRHGFIGQYHYQIIRHRVFHNRGNWFLHSSCLKSLFPEEEGHWTGFPFQALMELYSCAFPILFSLKIFTGNNNFCTDKRVIITHHRNIDRFFYCRVLAENNLNLRMCAIEVR